MKVSRQQVAEHREKILEAASRLFRERGFAAVTVREVMEAAGLTHGGFYGHFASKEELIAHSLTHALTHSAPRERDLGRYVGGYLSAAHRENLAGGCATAALGAETVRQTPAARAAMTAGIKQQLEHFSEGAPGSTASERRRAVIGSWSAMVGALILSRLSDDPELSAELLRETRAFLNASRPARSRKPRR
jgi:TetR/AcrR family transcriptional regulator, transcriptional repressor for nem operon